MLPEVNATNRGQSRRLATGGGFQREAPGTGWSACRAPELHHVLETCGAIMSPGQWRVGVRRCHPMQRGSGSCETSLGEPLVAAAPPGRHALPILGRLLAGVDG
jgi:hypothetical protein